MVRQRLHCAISLCSLAVGGCRHHRPRLHSTWLNFDGFHGAADRILRERGEGNLRVVRWATSGALARRVEAGFPQVEVATKSRMYTVNVRAGQDLFTLRQGHIDGKFLDLFDFPFLRGPPETAFPTPYSVVITRKVAELCFGDGDPIGQRLTLESLLWRPLHRHCRHRHAADRICSSTPSTPASTCPCPCPSSPPLATDAAGADRGTRERRHAAVFPKTPPPTR